MSLFFAPNDLAILAFSPVVTPDLSLSVTKNATVTRPPAELNVTEGTGGEETGGASVVVDVGIKAAGDVNCVHPASGVEL